MDARTRYADVKSASFVCMYHLCTVLGLLASEERKDADVTPPIPLKCSQCLLYKRQARWGITVQDPKYRWKWWNEWWLSSISLLQFLTITTGTLCKIHIITEVTWYPHTLHLWGHNIWFDVIHSHSKERSCGNRCHFSSLPPHTL